MRAKGAIADRAYDADALRALRAATGMEAVIPARRHRKAPIAHAATLCRERNRIERRFNKLKRSRHIATRFDRRDTCFLGFLQLACALLWLR